MEFEFERKAIRGDPLPKTLDIADSCLYIALKNLYSMYRDGRISRKLAKEEKQSLIYNWTKDKSKLEFISRKSLDLSARISEASKKYRDCPSNENADKLYAAFYNLPENWRNEK